MKGSRLAAIVALAAGGAGMAFPGESSFRALYVGYHPTQRLDAQSTVGVDPDETTRSHRTFEADPASGPGLEFSQRFGRWWGYTVHLSRGVLEFSRHEVVQRLDGAGRPTSPAEISESRDETVFIPLLGLLNIHLLPPGRFDLYAGPLVGYSWYDELFDGWVDDHFIYGLGAGLDVGLGGGWAFSAALRFVEAEAEPREGGPLVDGTGEINVDPWQVQLGIAYRFGGER